jgi:carboxypeptidase Q
MGGKQLTDWGLKNVRLEPWEFGHPGWSNERASAFLVSPVQENLKFEVLAWTPSTKGTVTASAIQLVPPQGPPPPPRRRKCRTAAAGGRGGRGGFPGRGGAARLGPTKAEMDEWVKANQSKVKGKVVLVGKAAVIPVNFDTPAKRRDDEQVKAQYDPNNPNAGRGRGGFGGAGRGRRRRSEPADPGAGGRTDRRHADRSGGAVVRLNDAARGDGIIVAQQHRAYDPAKTVPTLILVRLSTGCLKRRIWSAACATTGWTQGWLPTFAPAGVRCWCGTTSTESGIAGEGVRWPTARRTCGAMRRCCRRPMNPSSRWARAGRRWSAPAAGRAHRRRASCG